MKAGKKVLIKSTIHFFKTLRYIREREEEREGKGEREDTQADTFYTHSLPNWSH
ncbi:MAG: hypothetical protein ACKESB_00345 [Candidatus Hodgkinia cicadicola]